METRWDDKEDEEMTPLVSGKTHAVFSAKIMVAKKSMFLSGYVPRVWMMPANESDPCPDRCIRVDDNALDRGLVVPAPSRFLGAELRVQWVVTVLR